MEMLSSDTAEGREKEAASWGEGEEKCGGGEAELAGKYGED